MFSEIQVHTLGGPALFCRGQLLLCPWQLREPCHSADTFLEPCSEGTYAHSGFLDGRSQRSFFPGNQWNGLRVSLRIEAVFRGQTGNF